MVVGVLLVCLVRGLNLLMVLILVFMVILVMCLRMIFIIIGMWYLVI